jgi:hypothetical protein
MYFLIAQDGRRFVIAIAEYGSYIAKGNSLLPQVNRIAIPNFKMAGIPL